MRHLCTCCDSDWYCSHGVDGIDPNVVTTVSPYREKKVPGIFGRNMINHVESWNEFETWMDNCFERKQKNRSRCNTSFCFFYTLYGVFILDIHGDGDWWEGTVMHATKFGIYGCGWGGDTIDTTKC